MKREEVTGILRRVLFDKTFFLIVIVYFALNLPFLDSYPPVDYTGDESWHMNYSIELIKTGRIKGSMFPFAGGLNEGNIFGPWLYNGTLSAFFILLGKGIWQGRLLSFLCGLLTLYITYRIGKDFHNRSVGIIASAFLGTSIFFTWSMREIRPEAMFTMILTAGYYFFLRFLHSGKASHIFLSSFLIALLIEVHPNAVVASLSLIILYLVLYRKVFNRNTLFLVLGFITVGVLWFFINYLPNRESALSSFQTVHKLYMPALLEGDWNQYWYIVKNAPLADLGFILTGHAMYMNNIDIAVPFIGVIAVFIIYLITVRRNLRKILPLILAPLSLWVSVIVIALKIRQPGYLTYFMPLFSVILSASLFEIREHFKSKKVISYFIYGLTGLIITSGIVDTTETNMRFKRYKRNYDYVIQKLKITLPHDAVVLGSTNYYQAFLGSERYYTWTFMQESCPDFGMTVKALNVDYVILDDILRNLSIGWCSDIYYERQIIQFLREQCELIGSIKAGYPNFNGTDNALKEVHIFKVKKDLSGRGGE